MPVNVQTHVEEILREESGVKKLDPTVTIDQLFQGKRAAYATAMVRLQQRLGPLMSSRICDDGVNLLRTFTVERFVWAIAKNCQEELPPHLETVT